MSPIASPDFENAASGLLGLIHGQAGVHCVCLWYHDGGGRLRLAGTRPERPDGPSTMQLKPDDATWVEGSSGTVWRMSTRPMTGEGVEGLLFVQYAVGGTFVAELGLDAGPDVASGIMADIGRSLGLLAAMLEGRADGQPTTEYHAIDADLIESIAMGDSAFMVELLEIAATELVDGLRDLTENMTGGRMEVVSSLAHRMRSTARTLGASVLDDALLDLENASRREDTSASTEFLRIASEAVNATRADVQRMLESRRP